MGKNLWNTTQNYPGGLAVSPSGSIYVAGYATSRGYDPVRSYAWLLKITPEGCIDTLCGMTTGVDISYSAAASGSLSIYPNPSRGTIYWAYPNPKQSKDVQQIEVWNAMGQLRYQTTANTAQRIDISTLPTGIYTLILRGDRGRIAYREQVMKIH